MNLLCDRCSWPVPLGCTCRPVDAARLAAEVDQRHRDAVKLARSTMLDRWGHRRVPA